MKKRATKKAISMALAAAMAFAPVQAFAASSDIKGHWAESAITSWQDKGLISGYTDGTFKPDNSVTRAEFAAMVNKALGLTEKGEVPFSDVQSGSWYYDAISIAVKAGYCSGYEDGTFKPDATITRAEAAVMISLAKGLTQNTAAANGFADATNIPAWAKGYVGAVVGAGYMSGRPDGTFDATNTITRAEAVSSLDRAMGNTAVTDKDVVVTKDDTVIDGQTIEGNLIIDKAVGDGEVYVKNTTVAGNIIVQGGGDDSIYLENVTVKGKVIVEKEGVRVQFEGKTEATDVEVKAVCELKGRNFEGTVGTITIASDLGTSSAVKINVPATAVVISSKASVYVNANVDKVTVASDAKDSKLEVTSSAKIGTVVADGKVAISGSGKIEKLEANVDGITVSSSTTVTDTVVADGVEKPSTPSTGGGGGGSSSSSSSSNTESVTLTPGDNLQTILTNNKTSKNLTVNLPAGSYTVPQGGTLTYEGTGNLTINCAEGASFTEAVNGVSLAAAAPIALTINAPNVTGTVSVEGKTTGISELTFNAEKATVVASVPVTKVAVTNAKTLNVATGTTTTVTSSVDTLAVNVTNATEVTVSDDVATINVTKADKVTVDGEVANVNVNAETTIAGSGAITKLNANANVTVEATAVTEVAVEKNIDKITIADGAATKITVAEGATVTAVNTAENITVAGAGKITNVTSTTAEAVTVTGEDTVSVGTITGSDVTADGTLTDSTTVKKVTNISIKEGEYKTKYALNEELDLTGIVLEVTYSDGDPEEITVKDNASVSVTGFDSSSETDSKEITISYAGKTATYNISVSMTDAQIISAAKEKLAVDENVTKLVAEAGLKNDASITLPTEIKVGNADKYTVTVDWKSDNEAVAIAGGTVTVKQPAGADVTANVTATLSYGVETPTTDTATFAAKVLGVATLDTVKITAPEGVENGVKVGTKTSAFKATACDQHGEEFTTNTEVVISLKDGDKTSDSTGIAEGVLTIGADEKAETLTVVATATYKPVDGEQVIKTAEYTVKVLQLSSVATVTSTDYTVDEEGKTITVPNGTIAAPTTVADFKGKLTPADGAAIKVVASDSAESVTKDTFEGTSDKDGNIAVGDVVVVLAENKTDIAKYTVAEAEKVLSSEAKVTSSTYTVAEEGKTITLKNGTVTTTAVDTFKGNLQASEGATFKVLSSVNAESVTDKETFDDATEEIGNLEVGDVVVVLAEDKTTIVKYTIAEAPVEASATANGTVSGTLADGTATVSGEVTVTLVGDTFTEIQQGADLKSWITNAPTNDAMTVKAKDAVTAGEGTSVVLEFGGTVTATSEEQIKITIPETALTGNKQVVVTPSDSAKFAITEKSTTEVSTSDPVAIEAKAGEELSAKSATITVTGASSSTPITTDSITIDDQTGSTGSTKNGITAKVGTADSNGTVKIDLTGTPSAKEATTFTVKIPAEAITADEGYTAKELTATVTVNVAEAEKTEVSAENPEAIEGKVGEELSAKSATITVTGASSSASITTDNITIDDQTGSTGSTKNGITAKVVVADSNGTVKISLEGTPDAAAASAPQTFTVKIPAEAITADEGYAAKELSVTVTVNVAKAEISEAKVKGLVAPVKDATPVAKEALSVDGNDNISVESISWTTTDGSSPVEGNFGATTTYTATITLKAKDGYKFAGGATGKVYSTIEDDLNSSIVADSGTSVSVGGTDNDTLTITVKFNATLDA